MQDKRLTIKSLNQLALVALVCVVALTACGSSSSTSSSSASAATSTAGTKTAKSPFTILWIGAFSGAQKVYGDGQLQGGKAAAAYINGDSSSFGGDSGGFGRLAVDVMGAGPGRHLAAR